MAQTTRLEALSNNLANVTTPGFKRIWRCSRRDYAEATQRGIDYPGSRTINDLGGGVEICDHEDGLLHGSGQEDQD